jgi:hypothetical protein
MAGFGKAKGLGPPRIAVIVAYALALQSLLTGLAVFSPPSGADEGLSTFELCLNGHEAPASPPDTPGDVCGNHCTLGFAGTQHALNVSPPYRFQRIDIEIGRIHRPLDNRRLLSVGEYAVAQPRAPPRSA